jgi:hypothetical protein
MITVVGRVSDAAERALCTFPVKRQRSARSMLRLDSPLYLYHYLTAASSRAAKTIVARTPFLLHLKDTRFSIYNQANVSGERSANVVRTS